MSSTDLYGSLVAIDVSCASELIYCVLEINSYICYDIKYKSMIYPMSTAAMALDKSF